MDYMTELAAIAKAHGGIIEKKQQRSMASQRRCSISCTSCFQYDKDFCCGQRPGLNDGFKPGRSV